ncbi:unnamed protein product [Linum trigynum]|uniref:Uncharacterized protein n=1 Tax=Linum trigynum TaxID=586398 RepID=A0AAV2E249_9ROSI
MSTRSIAHSCALATSRNRMSRGLKQFSTRPTRASRTVIEPHRFIAGIAEPVLREVEEFVQHRDFLGEAAVRRRLDTREDELLRVYSTSRMTSEPTRSRMGSTVTRSFMVPQVSMTSFSG